MEDTNCLFLLLIFFCFLILDPGRPQCNIGGCGIGNQFRSLKGPKAVVTFGLSLAEAG